MMKNRGRPTLEPSAPPMGLAWGAGANAQSDSLPPLVRWPGGKRWLVPRILELARPDNGSRYFEPFFGGGALFFALRPAAATISDKNAGLMECYRAVRDQPRAVETALRGLPVGRGGYYEVRSTVPGTTAEGAARLIYLATHSFNGIYRENLKGAFNVPYGNRSYTLGSQGSLEAHSQALVDVEILDGDFLDGVSTAGRGDVVYLDPPYTVTHSRNGFVKYNAKVFSRPDQERLADVAHELASRGCRVIVSNAVHESVDALYEEFSSIAISRTSRMAADATRRGPISEIVYTNVDSGGTPNG